MLNEMVQKLCKRYVKMEITIEGNSVTLDCIGAAEFTRVYYGCTIWDCFSQAIKGDEK